MIKDVLSINRVQNHSIDSTPEVQKSQPCCLRAQEAQTFQSGQIFLAHKKQRREHG